MPDPVSFAYDAALDGGHNHASTSQRRLSRVRCSRKLEIIAEFAGRASQKARSEIRTMSPSSQGDEEPIARYPESRFRMVTVWFAGLGLELLHNGPVWCDSEGSIAATLPPIDLLGNSMRGKVAYR